MMHWFHGPQTANPNTTTNMESNVLTGQNQSLTVALLFGILVPKRSISSIFSHVSIVFKNFP